MKSRTRPPRFDAPDPVMRTAGAWLARRDRRFTVAEQADFAAWVEADASHAAAVAQLERTLTTFDRLRELAPHGATLDVDVFAPPRPMLRWRRAVVAAAGVAAVFAVVLWALRPASEDSGANYATTAGGYDRALLEDGSIVELNADTNVQIKYTPSERRVRLTKGEAHFQVAKDPSRPFVVETATVAVRAVGTAFNVRLAPTGVEVMVTEGRVRVGPPEPLAASVAPPIRRPNEPLPLELRPEIPLLTAGQLMRVSTAARGEPAQIAQVSREEMQRALAWQPRVVEFRNTPLGVAVAEFNRQNEQQLLILDEELESMRIGGNFRVDQPEAFVRLLETSFGINTERTGRAIELRRVIIEAP